MYNHPGGKLKQQSINSQKYSNNSMINDYQKIMKNNVPFGNNQMLNNNPAFFHNINDTSFYHKMNMEKMDKMRKIKNIDEIGVSKEKLTEFVICPIKVEKESGKELTRKYADKDLTYINPKNKKAIATSIINLWAGRNNNPYKNILKDADYNKNFKTEEDLIIHKVTLLDKNLIKTMAEFEEMVDFIEIHDGELQIKYSDKKEKKYQEKFDYENKIKYRVKYDPKNYDELKKFYKKEQKKIKNANKRVDEMIEMLLASENFTKEEMEEIEEINKSHDEEDLTNITMVFEKADSNFEKQLEKELENELAEEFGKDILNEFIKDQTKIEPREKIRIKDKNNEISTKKPIITVKTKKILREEDNCIDISNKPNKNRITMKTKKVEGIVQANKVGQVDEDELEEFRKQKKKKE